MTATPTAAQDAIAQDAAPQDPAPRLVPAFTIIAEIGPAEELGATALGPRRIIPITGGTVQGEGISGTVRPGAWDWQVDRADGCTDLEADYFVETDDGAVINVNNRATICRPAAGEAPVPVYTRPVFEPPLGAYQWLGQGTFIGRLGLATDHSVPAVRIEVFRVQ
ncbi:DUF3237 family protein [Aurantiacibacter arachoides]|nr:DUF3237 family protein [Aurantiacibacter arachoides]